MATFLDRSNPVDELADAVAALIEPQIVEHEGRLMRLSSILDQLVEASEPSSGVTGTGSVYRVPAHLDVVALLAAIDRTAAVGLRRVGYRGRLDHSRADLIRMWASHAGEWRATAPEYLYDAIGLVRRWVTRATTILAPDPQQIETRAQPCPNCKSRTAMVWSDDLGERVQRASLYLDKVAMVVYCRCCGAQWPAPTWSLLCAVLEDQSALSSCRSSSEVAS